MSYEIKALNAPGILDNAVKLLRENFKTLFIITVVSTLPLDVIRNLILASNMEKVGGFRLGMSTEELQTWLRGVQEANSPLVKAMTWLEILIINPFTVAALTYAISTQYLNKKTSVAESLRIATQTFLSIIWVRIILGLGLFGAAMLGALIIGVAAAFTGLLALIPSLALAVALIYLLLRFSLITAAIVLDGKRGLKALERSSDLMVGNYSTLLLLGLITSLLTLVLFMFGTVDALIPIVALRVGIQACLNSALLIFSTCWFVVFYYSCRCNRENFDLGLLAENIAGPVIPTASVETTSTPHADPAQPQ